MHDSQITLEIIIKNMLDFLSYRHFLLQESTDEIYCGNLKK